VPELPDITVYVEALAARLIGHKLTRIAVLNPFLLRSAEIAPQSCIGHEVRSIRRLGKRIAIGLDDELWIVIHLMIAGRLHWYDASSSGKVRAALLHLQFDTGLLTLTEAGTKRRASLHILRGSAALQAHDRGGLEVLESSFDDFRQRMTLNNHTLKRALTDPAIVSGIGNAYSDEILHRARLSPLLQTRQMSDAQWLALHAATVATLSEWTTRLRAESANAFPEKVTAFHAGMAVHGRYGKPCPVCGTAVQRIRYADNETNYCPRCQTGGKVLADRSLSKLLKSDWPLTIEELEMKKQTGR
jgi:formamidopyrimidine-DNA glycosylase